MNRSAKIVSVALGVVVLGGLAAYKLDDLWREYRFKSSWITQTSLVQLIATPERFDHKRVAVNGFLYCEPGQEVCGIYLSETDLEHGIGNNGIEVNFFAGNFKHGEWKKFNAHYVRLVGRFEGHAPSQWVIMGNVPVLGEVEQLKFRPETPMMRGPPS
jgi:hypothetical protein